MSTLKAALKQRLRQGEVLSALHPRAYPVEGWWGEGVSLNTPAPEGWPLPKGAAVIEGREGYRFGPENLTLAWALKGMQARSVVDLGAGSGSLGLIAAWSVGAERLVSVERQAEQVNRLSRSFEGFSQADCVGAPRCEVLCADLREPTLRAQVLERLEERGGAEERAGAELIVLNPPFFPEGWGRASESLEVHASTHSLHGDVGDFLTCARALLAPQGRVVVLYDAGRLADLLPAISATGFSLLSVHYTPETRLDRPPTPFRVWVSLGLAPHVDHAGGARVYALERSTPSTLLTPPSP